MTATNQKINKTYSVQPYVHEKYGLEDVELTFKKESELPFYSSLFARYKATKPKYKSAAIKVTPTKISI